MTVRAPDWAASCAMPAPIVPAPMTPIVLGALIAPLLYMLSGHDGRLIGYDHLDDRELGGPDPGRDRRRRDRPHHAQPSARVQRDHGRPRVRARARGAGAVR